MGKLCKLFSGGNADCIHGLYVWWLTAACLSGMLGITLTRVGPIAEHAVDDLAAILTTVVCTYLGVEVVSRSQVLHRLADRIGGSTVASTDPNQPPAPTPTQ